MNNQTLKIAAEYNLTCHILYSLSNGNLLEVDRYGINKEFSIGDVKKDIKISFSDWLLLLRINKNVNPMILQEGHLYCNRDFTEIWQVLFLENPYYTCLNLFTNESRRYHKNGMYISDQESHKDLVKEITYPLNGYAPGNYGCTCGNCKKEFMGDKRAVRCEQCALNLVIP